jgi:hypothetical protein
MAGTGWKNVVSNSGDIDVLPVGEDEDHVAGAKCICGPRVEIIGARLLTVHNAFDKREFVEQAIAIMNGDE